MPSFSVLPGVKVFLFTESYYRFNGFNDFNDLTLYPHAGLSITNPFRRNRRSRLKDQRMKKICSILARVLLALAVRQSSAVTITENFSSNPLANGWQVFGDTNLFHWDSTSQNLRVTWDSSRTNSYFYHPLRGVVTRHDDFQIEFDLRLNDIMSGNEPGKTGPLEIGVGFLNLSNATHASFGRAIYGGAPNIAEFDYFPPGYYDFGPVAASTTPTFISSTGFSYAPTVFAPYEFELPTNQVIHVSMTYTATNQTLVTLLTTNGALLFRPPDAVLNDTNRSGFSATNDFRVDTFSVSSYSSFGTAYDSVLAHGVVDNILVTLPPPVQDLAASLTSSVWQVQFNSRSNWLYTLERTTDLATWLNVSSAVPGNAANLFLQDTNPPVEKAFYRVRAERP